MIDMFSLSTHPTHCIRSRICSTYPLVSNIHSIKLTLREDWVLHFLQDRLGDTENRIRCSTRCSFAWLPGNCPYSLHTGIMVSQIIPLICAHPFPVFFSWIKFHLNRIPCLIAASESIHSLDDFYLGVDSAQRYFSSWLPTRCFKVWLICVEVELVGVFRINIQSLQFF